MLLENGERIKAKRYFEVVKKHFVLFYKMVVSKYGLEVVTQEDNAS